MTRVVINVQGVDEEIWRKFRARCALLNKPTGTELTSALYDYLENCKNGSDKTRKGKPNSSIKSI